MAMDEWNKQGGVLGHHLEAVIYDTACTFQEGQATARQAIADGVQFIIGPLCSEAAVAVALEAELAGIVVIAPTALHSLVTVNAQDQPRATVFSLSYNPEWQGQAAANFAQETLGLNRAAILYQPGDPYATALTQGFTSRFSNAGGEIVYQAAYDPDSSELTELATTLQQAEARLVYLPANAQMASRIIDQLQASQASISSTTSLLFLGNDNWEGEMLDRNLVQGSYFPVHFSGQNQHLHVQPWVETYQSTFAGEPDTLAVLNYDAMNILAQAIQQAATTEPGSVAKIIEQGRFEAITGPISFNADHTPAKPVPFVQVKDGQLSYMTSILP